MTEKEIIKGSFISGDKEFISYASDWELYEGNISWDNLNISQQNRIIKAVTTNYEGGESEQSIAMEIGVRKKPIEGLRHLLLTISFLFENARIIDDATEWSDSQKAVVVSFLQGTMLGCRLEKIFANINVTADDLEVCAVYEAELERLCGEEQYTEMLDYNHPELKGFTQLILSHIPDLDGLKKIKNDLLQNDTKEKTRKIAVLLYTLASQKKVTNEDVDAVVSETSIYGLENSIGSLKKMGALNYVSTEIEPYFDSDEGDDDALVGNYTAWLTVAGEKLASHSKVVSEKYIAERKESKVSSEIRRKKDILDAQLRKEELLREINEVGGRVENGLYHQSRRIRAKVVDDNWIISGDEQDLISAIGRNKFSTKINKVDLKKGYGLHVQRELAPVDVVISELGTISIERNDEWGQGAKPYVDTRSLMEKMGVSSWGDMVALILFAPAFIAEKIGDRFSSKTNTVLSVLYLVAIIIVMAGGAGNGLKTLSDWLHLALVLYLLPALIMLFSKSSINSQ